MVGWSAVLCFDWRLEEAAAGLTAEDALDVGARVELVVEPRRDGDGAGRVAVLDDDDVVGLEEVAPLLEEVEVADWWWRRGGGVEGGEAR